MSYGYSDYHEPIGPIGPPVSMGMGMGVGLGGGSGYGASGIGMSSGGGGYGYGAGGGMGMGMGGGGYGGAGGVGYGGMGGGGYSGVRGVGMEGGRTGFFHRDTLGLGGSQSDIWFAELFQPIPDPLRENSIPSIIADMDPYAGHVETLHLQRLLQTWDDLHSRALTISQTSYYPNSHSLHLLTPPLRLTSRFYLSPPLSLTTYTLPSHLSNLTELYTHLQRFHMICNRVLESCWEVERLKREALEGPGEILRQRGEMSLEMYSEMEMRLTEWMECSRQWSSKSEISQLLLREVESEMERIRMEGRGMELEEEVMERAMMRKREDERMLEIEEMERMREYELEERIRGMEVDAEDRWRREREWQLERERIALEEETYNLGGPIY